MPRLWLLAVFWVLFAALCFVSAHTYSFPYVNLDEHAHFSYALALHESTQWQPDIGEMRLYDFAASRWGNFPNYINHPAAGYHLLNMLIDWRAVTAQVRYASLSFYLLGYAAILAAFYEWQAFSLLALALAALTPILLRVIYFAGIFSNDSIAFLGGGLAVMGSVIFVQGESVCRIHRGLCLMLAGLALAIAAKMTSCLLIGLYVVLILLMQYRYQRLVLTVLRRPLPMLLGVLCLLMTIPYLCFWIKFGSPVPNTEGQVLLLRGNAGGHSVMPFTKYLLTSLHAAMLTAGADAASLWAYRIFGGGGILIYVLCCADRRKDLPQRCLRIIARCSFIATIVTLGLHLAFSYQRHLAYGWQPELYPRYYFPLLGGYCLVMFGYLQNRLSRFSIRTAEKK